MLFLRVNVILLQIARLARPLLHSPIEAAGRIEAREGLAGGKGGLQGAGRSLHSPSLILLKLQEFSCGFRQKGLEGLPLP